MAIRVQNREPVVFGLRGTGEAEAMATHGRFQKGDDSVVVQLEQPVTVAENQRLRVPAGGLRVIYREGNLPDSHMMAVVSSYWTDEAFMVDLMSDSMTVIGVGWYSQQEVPLWDVDEV